MCDVGKELFAITKFDSFYLHALEEPLIDISLKLHFEYSMVPLIDACFYSILADVPRSSPGHSKAFDSVIAIKIWKYGKDMFGLV